MKWYIPSWNGDLRIEPDSEEPKCSRLVAYKPTPGEKKSLQEQVGPEVLLKGWAEASAWERFMGQKLVKGSKSLLLAAPVDVVGPIVADLIKPGPAKLSTFVFRDGEMVADETARGLAKKSEEKIAKKGEPKAAVTVKRPTPSCPECEIGAVSPASEVLLEFLSPEQHETWAKDRYILVDGERSGHRYVLAHRHTERAKRQTKICFDLDDARVLHFHDSSVPPEEEILSAKLILEHRESWLRNEATCVWGPEATDVYKNPFGGVSDGVADATLTRTIGGMAFGLNLTFRK